MYQNWKMPYLVILKNYKIYNSGSGLRFRVEIVAVKSPQRIR